MELWKGKVAVITGASSGIGAALCKDLCKHDVKVVGLARRIDRLNQLKGEIESETKSAQFFPIKCDLTNEEDIKSAFDQTIDKFGGVDILVNNAGIVGSSSILEDDSDENMKKIIDTNVFAVISCTKKAYKSMTERDVPSYIFIVSSVVGHSVPNFGPIKPTLSVYPSSKYAMTALNQVLRSELNYYKKNKIRISNISPGLVRTEIAQAAGVFSGDYPIGTPILESEDISNAIIYKLGTPPRVQFQDIIIKPTGETF